MGRGRMTLARAHLLDAFPLVRTANVDQLRTGVACLFQDSRLEIRGRELPTSSMNYCPLHHTGILYGQYGADIDVSFGEMNFYVQGVTIRGFGEQITDGQPTSADVGGLLSPGANLRLRFAPGFELLALKIETDALVGKIEAMVGTALNGPIRLQLDPHFAHPALRRMRRLIRFLAEQISSRPDNMPLAAVAEMEQLLMICFLIGHRHNHSHLLDRQAWSAAPWQIRRAEEYMEGNWDQPITIEALANLTGASARSIFHAFKQARGYSPMAFVKQVRLQRAWQMLSKPRGDISVTSVAYACGFGNLGHFAGYFRKKFGESPSAVLSRSRGGLT